MKIYLVRHAPTESTRSDIYVGITDEKLSVQGWQEASALGDFFADKQIETVLCSDLKRSQDTAMVIAQACRASLSVEKQLREINFGDLEGKDFNYVSEHFPLLVDCWKNNVFDLTFPNGDNYESFAARVEQFANDLINRLYENVVVVGHGGFLKILTCFLMKIDKENWWKFKYATSSVSLFRVVDGIASMLTFNDASHLRK